MKIHRYPSDAAEKRIAAIAGRELVLKKKDLAAVARILEDVRKKGDEALIGYVNQFDAPGLAVEDLRVTEDEMAAAAEGLDPSFTRALDRAAAQIEAHHRRQLRQSWITTDRPGTLLGQLVRPVERAGVYVPGGRAGKTPLVSSVLMGVIPARIAGVDRVVMTTPPTAEGTVSPHLLAAAGKAGADAVYKAGSAWAVGALAYGTETIPKVDVIVGPGNIYVTIAKKIVSGTVGIDMIAGPSEILVIADDGAVPEYVAADLLSQAEHDVLSSAILLTTSERLARKAARAVKAQLRDLSRGETAAESLKRYGAMLVVPDLPTAVDLANRIAPEHLELQVREPFELLGGIRNAGAVFLGSHTPEPVGDYVAGPNHVLPTAGTARFSSALSVDHFMKKTSIIHYNEAAFRAEADDIVRLAEIEGLDAHANAVKVRLG